MPQNVTAHTLAKHLAADAICEYDVDCSLRNDEVEFLREFMPLAPARILDLGVGNGRTTIPLLERGYDVVGIEYCDELVSVAKRRFPQAPITQGDARNLDFPDASFDAAWFSFNGIDYMYPLSERLGVFQEVWRVLKPGGTFLFSSHNALGVIYRLLKPIGLTLRGLRFVSDQCRLKRPMANWYCIWSGDALKDPLFYSAPPVRQIALVKQQGWEVLGMRSVERCGKPVSWWRDVHIHYAIRKPL